MTVLGPLGGEPAEPMTKAWGWACTLKQCLSTSRTARRRRSGAWCATLSCSQPA